MVRLCLRGFCEVPQTKRYLSLVMYGRVAATSTIPIDYGGPGKTGPMTLIWLCELR